MEPGQLANDRQISRTELLTLDHVQNVAFILQESQSPLVSNARYGIESIPLKPFSAVNIFPIYFVEHSHENRGRLIHGLLIISKIGH